MIIKSDITSVYMLLYLAALSTYKNFIGTNLFLHIHLEEEKRLISNF